MCGGELLKIPCSRIGKIMKVSKELYGKDSSDNSTKGHLINYNRIVDIWWSEEHQSEFRRLEPDWTKFESKDLEGFYQNSKKTFSDFNYLIYSVFHSAQILSVFFAKTVSAFYHGVGDTTRASKRAVFLGIRRRLTSVWFPIILKIQSVNVVERYRQHF